MNTSRLAITSISACIAGLALTSCTPAQNSDTTWQIANVYVNPDTPSGLPDGVRATVVFGESTVTGDTGCAPFQGRVDFDNPDNPTFVRFRDMHFRDATCTGPERYFHDTLVTLLDGDFSVKNSDQEMLLTKRPNDLNAPAVRLVTAR